MDPQLNPALIRIKWLHTVVWVFFVSCIVLIPAAAATRRFAVAAVCSSLVLLECAVLAVNRCRCPLTDAAGRYTSERTANFDIYLPEWLARWNKEIFGTLFVCGEAFFLYEWLRAAH